MPVTEEVLKKRLGKIQAGSLFPQAYITFTVCLGQIAFGAIYGWSIPATKHLGEMLVDDYEANYAWTLSMGPLATAIGMYPCWFFAKRIGPRKTMLVQTPFNIIFWIVLLFATGIRTYHVCRFFAAFFSTTYYYCGEQLILETVHRKYQKLMYSFIRTSFFIGILLVNIVAPFMGGRDVFIVGAVIVGATFLLLIWPPESPVHLMRHNHDKARKSLMWYRGKKEIKGEIDVISNYVTFQKYETRGSMPMLKSTVIRKTLVICAALFIMKGISGYYAFIVHSPRWFSSKLCCFSPYIDNIIFLSFIVIVRFISLTLHLYKMFGIKKPLLVSTFSCCVLLIVFGFYKFMLEKASEETGGCVILPTIFVYACSYELGLSICPELTLYHYTPFQVYMLANKIMQMVQWIIVFIVIKVYLVSITKLNAFVILWVMAFNMFIGYIIVMICIVEVKGQSLMKIQIELGGNPIGTRGSRRQRIATPLEPLNTDHKIRDLIMIYAKEFQSQENKNDPA